MAYGSVNVTGASSQDVKAVDTKAQEIIDNIGDTEDTGGSSSTGTVFGKLNKIISDLASHISAWTSARAGYIDEVKANTEDIKTLLSSDDIFGRKFGSAIEIGYGSVNHGEVTINGKGVATVSNSALTSGNCVCSIIIDGVASCTNLNIKSKSFDFEFNNSFVLNVSSSIEVSYQYTLY